MALDRWLMVQALHAIYANFMFVIVVIVIVVDFFRCRIKTKRRFVQPNNGFMVQLRLFHKMGWKIDPSHEKFKLYRLRMAADKVRKGIQIYFLHFHNITNRNWPMEKNFSKNSTTKLYGFGEARSWIDSVEARAKCVSLSKMSAHRCCKK